MGDDRFGLMAWRILLNGSIGENKGTTTSNRRSFIPFCFANLRAQQYCYRLLNLSVTDLHRFSPTVLLTFHPYMIKGSLRRHFKWLTCVYDLWKINLTFIDVLRNFIFANHKLIFIWSSIKMTFDRVIFKNFVGINRVLFLGRKSRNLSFFWLNFFVYRLKGFNRFPPLIVFRFVFLLSHFFHY